MTVFCRVVQGFRLGIFVLIPTKLQQQNFKAFEYVDEAQTLGYRSDFFFLSTLNQIQNFRQHREE